VGWGAAVGAEAPAWGLVVAVELPPALPGLRAPRRRRCKKTTFLTPPPPLGDQSSLSISPLAEICSG